MSKIILRARSSFGPLFLTLLLALGVMTLARPAEAQVTPAADLSILKFDIPSDTVAVGDPLNYELAVSNNGPGAATGVRVTDTLPANTRFIAFVPGNPGTCTVSGNTVTCDLAGLDANEDVSIFFDVCPISPGTATNTAEVAGTSTDPTATNNTATETTEVTPGSGGCAAQPPPPRPQPPQPQPPNPQPRPNAAPDARNDSFSTREDRALTVRRPGVLRNDRDADGDRLRARVVKGPRHGRLTLRADGSFVYRPDRDYNGRDTFVYSVSDGKGGTDRATVSIRVRPAPSPGGEPNCAGGAAARGSDASTCNAAARGGDARAGDSTARRR